MPSVTNIIFSLPRRRITASVLLKTHLQLEISLFFYFFMSRTFFIETVTCTVQNRFLVTRPTPSDAISREQTGEVPELGEAHLTWLDREIEVKASLFVTQRHPGSN
jgi:hypothetical protein